VESFCESGNKPLGSIKCWKVLEWLHNQWHLVLNSIGDSVSKSQYTKKLKTKLRGLRPRANYTDYSYSIG
jgi:hypothetical protein